LEPAILCVGPGAFTTDVHDCYTAAPITLHPWVPAITAVRMIRGPPRAIGITVLNHEFSDMDSSVLINTTSPTVKRVARVFRNQGDDPLTGKLDVRTKSTLFRPRPQVKGCWLVFLLSSRRTCFMFQRRGLNTCFRSSARINHVRWQMRRRGSCKLRTLL
jgi:hypothetical protein